MIKAETTETEVSVSIVGDSETIQGELMAVVTTITETLIGGENVSPEEATDKIKRCCRVGMDYAIHRLKQKEK
ncbi:hypothetical protein [uncultured Eubacterium sp.]|uniref:hypothetical protein n=1 Tax=uncultured Eubacterium sp. TaxID=165185 RepID=UPI0025995825|nr:hypothetical protein [uncultured Eubacterium sp.]